MKEKKIHEIMVLKDFKSLLSATFPQFSMQPNSYNKFNMCQTQ